MMSFRESISTCLLEKVVTLSGRASRSEYWWYALFTSIVEPLIYGGFMGVVYMTQLIEDGVLKSILAIVLVLLILCQILILCSSVCATVRRLHDSGKSGFWFFISFIPIVGSIILLIFLISDSKKEDNEYGAYVSL